MANIYRVVGGEHADTDFIVIAGSEEPERHGPFASHDVARL